MANEPVGGLDPQAAIAKHAAVTQSGAAGDQAIITRIETSIANSPMGWLQAQFGEVNSRAASEQGQVNSKVSEHKNLVSTNQKDAPPDAGSAPTLGPAAHPAVKSSAGASKGGPSSPKSAGGGAAPTSKKAPGGGVSKGGAPSHAAATPAGLAQQLGGAQNDAQLDGMLNGYTPKSPQPTEMVGRIKQMEGIAQGFRGQLDVYVAQGGAVEGALASATNFLGVGKDASAVWATNPYRKMHGFLGGVMTGLSGLKSVTSLVGSICGKLGLVLTVVGLLGMIFPPIGVAVSGIARILNVVGLICDAISFVLSAILTGLNGVVLAKQIAAGASAEEKAATADLMMSEANDAASGLINLGMMFGGKFMKGLTQGSRGVINSLIRRFKAVVGRVSLKLTGNIKNFANRIVRRLGFGGARLSRVGGTWKDTGLLARTKERFAATKVGKFMDRNSAPKVIDRWQDGLMKKYGNSAFAKRLDRVGAWSGATAKKWDIEERVGSWGEKAGKGVGGLGANSTFGKSMAKATDAAERETREAAMRIAQRDAMHLEETRWKNHLAERQAKRQADGMQGLSPEAQNRFAQGQGQRVGDKAKKDFDLEEKDFLKNQRKTERDELRDQAKLDKATEQYRANPTTGNREHRDQYMEKLHKSREKRWRLEKKYTDDGSFARQKELNEIAQRSPAQQQELTRLNKRLTDYDKAKATNIQRETELSTIAGQRETEVHSWKDISKNIKDTGVPVLEMLHIKEQQANWEAAEAHQLRKTLKFDKGAAKGGAASRGGAGTYADIALEQRRQNQADFAAFVALGRPSPSTAQTARSMLSSINRAPAPAPATQPMTSATPAPSPTAAPAPTPAPSVASSSPSPASATSGMTAMPASTPGVTVSTTPAAPSPIPVPNTAQAPQVPAPVPEPADEGGGEPLPYWPSLLPEFDKAMGDFGFMRNVASEFKKAQIVGKQKAVDTLAIYGRYQEYADARKAQAKQNQTQSQQTQANTQENAGHAGQTSSQAGQGEAKQGEAKGAASNRAAVDLPEPETRGFWGRILGGVKRWAKNKAAQIFGWIQEKVASVILKGLCGVSMGDLRDYAGALRRQQMSAQQVASGAVTRSGSAEQQSIKLKSGAVKEAQGAADAIGECDRNIVEADTFMGDVTSFETQLAQEKAHAQAFLGQVHAAVHAEQARKRREAEQEAAQEAADLQLAQQQAAAQGGEGGAPDAGPSVAPSPAAAANAPTTGAPADTAQVDTAADSDQDGVPDSAENEAAKAQIVATAAYVGNTAERMTVQVQGRAEDYKNQLSVALTNRTGEAADGTDLQAPAKRESQTILDAFKEFVTSTKQEMEGFRDVAIDPSSAGRIADAIISSAEQLDSHYDQSMQGLDELFERTYTGIREGKRNMYTRLIGEGGTFEGVNEGASNVTDRAFETAVPAMNSVADTLLSPFQQGPAAAPAPAPTTTPSSPLPGPVNDMMSPQLS